MGGHLLEEYQHKKADKKLRTEGYQEISGQGVKVVRPTGSAVLPQREEFHDPLSSGSHRVTHQHEGLSPLGQGAAELEPPPLAKGEALLPTGEALLAEPRFQKVRDDLIDRYTGQARFTPVHGFRISRTEPYSLVKWERAASAKAMALKTFA
jgi:hypothetical protein